MTRHIFPAGTYYVGDLCYAVSDDDWSKLIDDIGCFGLNSSKVVDVEKFDDGVFYHQNKKCFIAGTKHGDGSYFDRNNEVYYVDSGSLGVMPLDVCNGTSMNGGQTHTFKEEFEVWENDGNLHFDNNYCRFY